MYTVAGFALTAMMLLTVADVILRSFKRPIVGTYELVGMLGAVAVGFAIPQASRVKGHVIMDFLTGRLPAFWRRALHAVTRILAISTFVIIGWNLWRLADGYRRLGEVTPTLQVPLYPVSYGIAICCFVQCLVMFIEIFEKGEEGSEP
jgi:TRAP-type C4-dicarboxylate transport system permease small subunit